MTEAKREAVLIQLMRDVCDELGLPEEKQEHAPILEALNVAYNKGAESTSQPAERDGQWVSCEERMPGPIEGETVLMCFTTTEVLTGAWDGDDWLCGDTIIPRRHVTHWMPLPDPPQPKET